MRAMDWEKLEREWKYGKSATEQMCWYRDQISGLLRHQLPDSQYGSPVTDCWVAGWHTSKSVNLPVYCWRIPSGVIVARDNFHNVNCTVSVDSEIILPAYFKIDDAKGYLFMEQYKCSPYEFNKREFSFATWTRQQFYAIMWCIASQVKL